MRVVFGSFTFDSATRELLDEGRRTHMSPKAFDLLQLLLERQPAVVSKQDIHERLWQDTFVTEASLSVVIAEIRQVLRDDSRQSRFIRTVHRVGYAFSGAVEVAAPVRSDHAPRLPCWLVHEGRSFALGPGSNIVGRDPRSDVWVDASGVSRRHARIDVDASGATIVDLDSSNGTFIKGKRLAGPQRLIDGDAIELGAATLVFRVWSDETAVETERITRT